MCTLKMKQFDGSCIWRILANCVYSNYTDDRQLRGVQLTRSASDSSAPKSRVISGAITTFLWSVLHLIRHSLCAACFSGLFVPLFLKLSPHFICLRIPSARRLLLMLILSFYTLSVCWCQCIKIIKSFLMHWTILLTRIFFIRCNFFLTANLQKNTNEIV